MKTYRALIGLLTVVLTLALGGCTKDTTTGPGDQPPVGVTNEQDAMKNLAKNDEFVTNDEKTFDDGAVEPADYGTFGKVEADITPLRFGRFITSITKTVTVTIQTGDSIAIAVVNKDIIGVFKIKGINGTGDTVLIEKPFNDKSTRNVIFKRIARRTDRYWLNWVPIATSLVDGGTVPPNNNINITKLEAFLPNGDTLTITDPTHFYLRYMWLPHMFGNHRNVPSLAMGQNVRMRVTILSNSSDTDLVALRFGFDGVHKRRMRLTIASEVNNGDGTYTREFVGTWHVPPFAGFFHAGVDAMTRGTIFDDTAPYAAHWWGVPYRVFPMIGG